MCHRQVNLGNPRPHPEEDREGGQGKDMDVHRVARSRWGVATGRDAEAHRNVKDGGIP